MSQRRRIVALSSPQLWVGNEFISTQSRSRAAPQLDRAGNMPITFIFREIRNHQRTCDGECCRFQEHTFTRYASRTRELQLALAAGGMSDFGSYANQADFCYPITNNALLRANSLQFTALEGCRLPIPTPTGPTPSRSATPPFLNIFSCKTPRLVPPSPDLFPGRTYPPSSFSRAKLCPPSPYLRSCSLRKLSPS